MDKRSLVLIVLSFMVLFGYETYLNKKYPHRHTQSQPQETTLSQTALLHAPEDVQRDSLVNLSAADLTFENDVLKLEFDALSYGLSKVWLTAYQDDDRTGPYPLVDSLLSLEAGVGSPAGIGEGVLVGAHRSPHALEFILDQKKWRIKKIYTLPEKGYGLDVRIEWSHILPEPQSLVSFVGFSTSMPFFKNKYSFLPGMPTGRPALVINRAGKTEWLDLETSCSQDSNVFLNESSVELGFSGFDRHYFAMSLLPQTSRMNIAMHTQQHLKKQFCAVRQILSLDQGMVNPGATAQLGFKMWLGPKQMQLMESFDPKLENSIDLGFFGLLSRGLFKILELFYKFMGNWGLAIVMFTVALKLLFYPITKQSTLAMKRMQKYQPALNQLRETHKENPQKQQKEVLAFMAKHKLNPLKGCLMPVLIQMPVFIAFFRVLSTALELRQAPFYGWIHDLSVADPYFITPLLLGLFMILQQKLTPTAGMDQTQARIMLVMPIVFAGVSLTFPAGLVLYSLTNAVTGILQQQWLNRTVVV